MLGLSSLFDRKRPDLTPAQWAGIALAATLHPTWAGVAVAVALILADAIIRFGRSRPQPPEPPPVPPPAP